MSLKHFIDAWLGFMRRQPALFFLFLGLLSSFGIYSALNSEIEAFPEFTNIQVQVITQFPGKAAEEVERQLTAPLEVATTGLPGLINQRSISMFGLSVITLTFDDNVGGRQARLDVAQRLADADIPDGIKPSLSPDTTPVGEIYRYTLEGDLPVDEMRMIEDWELEKDFKSIPGVADVASFGGPTRTIDVRLDLARMKALGLSVSNVAQLLGQNHANAGGAMITHGEEGYVVRSIGLYERPEDLEAAVVTTQNHIPIRVRDIGRVQMGHKPRLGVVGRNSSDDDVEGIILLRQGGNTLETCADINAHIAHLNSDVLPKGVKIAPYYDRTDLIRRSSHTVFHNIIFGIILVCLLLTLGLGFRYVALVSAVALVIPFSLLVVFIILRWCDLAPNLISLGAVDFGIIIETAIFATEAVIVALARQKRSEKASDENLGSAFAAVVGPALLCALLLLIAFLPILSLQRVEGRIFRPLGITLVAALIGGQLGTFLFIPLAWKFSPTGAFKETAIDRFFAHLSESCVRVAKRLSQIPQLPLRALLLLLLFVLGLSALLGREFLPQLNEGSLYIRSTAPPTISFDASVALSHRIRESLKEIPEVVDVVSQTGRPDDGTDVNGFETTETFVSMVPPDQWKSAKTIEGFDIIAADKLKGIEGVDFNFSQPIKDNVDEAISGVKGELVLKVFGPDLKKLQAISDHITAILKAVPGAEDVAGDNVLGQPELRFQINRDLLDRYGLRVTDAEDVLETALMGKTAAKMTDDQGRAVDIVVKPNIGENPDRAALARLTVFTPDGARVSLGDIADPKLVEGVSHIYREGAQRRIAIKASVRARPVVEFVQEADQKIRKSITLPPHYHMEWSGSFENAQRAGRQLALIVPVCLIAICVLLHAWFKSWRIVGFVLWELPFAALGAVLFLNLFKLNLSISAAAGGVVLIGVTSLTAMMLLSDWQATGDIWHALREKTRGILVSNGVAIAGLVPAALSHGIGSETAKPFAVTILGGLITSLLLSLLLLPALVAGSMKKVN